MIKSFLDFKGARLLLSKYFRYVNDFYLYFFYLQEYQIRSQLMTKTIHEKQGPARLYFGFRVKRVVSVGLTNCFRKKILNNAYLNNKMFLLYSLCFFSCLAKFYGFFFLFAYVCLFFVVIRHKLFMDKFRLLPQDA